MAADVQFVAEPSPALSNPAISRNGGPLPASEVAQLKLEAD